MKIGLIGASGRQGKRMLLMKNGGSVLSRYEPLYEWDAVVVASPTSQHFTEVRAQLQLGRHVLCEKPLAESYEQVDELVTIAEQKGVQLMACHTYLHDEEFQECSRLIPSTRFRMARIAVKGRRVAEWLPHIAAVHVAMGLSNWMIEFTRSEASRLSVSWADDDCFIYWNSDVPSLGDTPMKRQLDAFISGDWKEDLRAVYRMVDEMKMGKPRATRAKREMN